MLFNSFQFLYFFIIVFIVSALLRKVSKVSELWFLVIASSYFYGQWSWSYLLLIYITIIADYIIGIKCFKSDNPAKFLHLSLIINLGILGFFKYINFLFDTGNSLFSFFSFNLQLSPIEILLPVGISFYTFQSLSYTIDIYRQNLKPRTQFVDYALFVSFFPQLVAGPIVRASEFFNQLDKNRAFTFQMAQTGMFLIMIGLVKKMVFADNLSTIVDPVFNAPMDFGAIQTLMAVYAFAFQIYFDFSGYTDIAIGVAMMLGFNFPKNFNHPYIALSIQDFWRRWHITLSRWLRDYLYISLGGNRKGGLLTLRNLFLTMFLGGLWHGASWNFAVWGILHGFYLAIERWIEKFKLLHWNLNNSFIKLAKWFIVFNLVCFAWIFFRAEGFEQSTTIISNIITWKSTGAIFSNDLILTYCIIGSLTFFHWFFNKLNLIDRSGTMKTVEYVFWQTSFLVLLMAFHAYQSDSFIYFQF